VEYLADVNAVENLRAIGAAAFNTKKECCWDCSQWVARGHGGGREPARLND
jgi:hypothetical protein